MMNNNHQGNRGPQGNSGQGQGHYGKPHYDNKPRVDVSSYVVLEKFYSDADKQHLVEGLFDKTAGEIAKQISGGVITKTQLRRIFDEVKRFKRILETSANEGEGREKFAAQLPYIKLIKSKLSYSIARIPSNKDRSPDSWDGQSKNLKAFVSNGLDLIKDKRDYEVFVTLFEAVYGFAYEQLKK